MARIILYHLFAFASALLRCAQSATTFLSAQEESSRREEKSPGRFFGSI